MNNKYLLLYTYSHKGKTGIGSAEITQNPITPITYEVLKDALETVRRKSSFDDTTMLNPISWKRFEDEGDVV